MRHKKCFFSGCENSTTTTPKKLFICVPSKNRKLWFAAAGKRPFQYVSASKSTNFCCEDHFNLEGDSENWLLHKMMGSRIILKEGVLPRKDPSKGSRFEDIKKSVQKAEQLFGVIEPSSSSSSEAEKVEDKQFVKKTKPGFKNNWTCTEAKKDVGVLTAPDTRIKSTNTSFVFSVENYINNEAKRTEVRPDSDYFDQSLYLKAESHHLETRSRFYLGLPRQDYSVIRSIHRELGVPLVNILIVLKKIKLNDGFMRLAADFWQNQNEIYKIFTKTVTVLANKMKLPYFWCPGLPIQRKTQNEIILDSFEVKLESGREYWNKYKHCNTCKYLISCSPNGLINFVSEKYISSCTDLEVVKQSGYIDVVSQATMVTADQSFKQIISAEHQPRIIVERLINNIITEFGILGKDVVVESHMVECLDDVIVIICGMLNIRLLKE